MFWNVLGSLVAAALIAAGSFLHSTSRIALWVGLSVFVTALLITSYLARNRRHRVFILVSAFHKKQFFADVTKHALDRLATRQLEGVLKLPATDYSLADQDRHFSEILKRKGDYVGGIVVPIEPAATGAQIQRFILEFGKPIVFLDTAPFSAEAEYPLTTCFVGFDNHAGGRKAAQALVHVLRDRSLASPRVLVIGSNVQTARQEEFRNHLMTAFPLARVVVDQNGYFLRDKARTLATHYFREARDHGKCYDAVFCTNDEMALGVIEALQTLPPKIAKQIFVVGYDAVQEAVKAIEGGNSPLKNSVVQDTREMAERAVDLLAIMLEGGTTTVPRVTLLDPGLCKPLDESLVGMPRPLRPTGHP